MDKILIEVYEEPVVWIKFIRAKMDTEAFDKGDVIGTKVWNHSYAPDEFQVDEPDSYIPLYMPVEN